MSASSRQLFATCPPRLGNDSQLDNAIHGEKTHRLGGNALVTMAPHRRILVPFLLIWLAGCGSATPGSTSSRAPAPSTSVSSGQPSQVTPTTTPTMAPPPLASIDLMPDLPTGNLPAPAAARLQAVLDDLVTRGAPDAIGAVITPDGTWTGAAGLAGPKARKATSRDEFNIASVSKPMLAALVLRLGQEGKIDLDAPLSTYLGDLPADANGATVRQALAMHSGIGDTLSSLQAEARADCTHAWTRAEVLRSIPPPHASAGSTFEYSNPTYKLLGYAVEHVTGKQLETAFDDHLFAPFGLNRVLLQGPSRATPKPWAPPIEGHNGALDLGSYSVGGALPCLSIATFSFATSAVASDAPSLARWGWVLFSGKLIDRDQLVAMTTVDNNDYGLGIERLPDFAPDLAYGTHGGQVGYAAFLAVLPARQTVIVAFINDDQADVQDVCQALARALVE